jgi:uncharacterized protein (TIGR04562 family)
VTRPAYLSAQLFNWETLHVVCSGRSSLDAKNYLTEVWGPDNVYDFLVGYGFDLKNPVEGAELFGIYQEALQFIKRYFLKEGNPDGLELAVPNFLYTLTDISELFLIATGKGAQKNSIEESLWAGVLLKVMHTILHTDKDLRYRYFSVIQQQVFDRFYKYISRDPDNRLFLKHESFSIPLHDFETKAKKTRESIIIKLLHKQENVAEELFDRIGVRFVTYSKLDALRVIKFLVTNYVLMINNIKPSRSQNTLVDLDLLKQRLHGLLKKTYRGNLNEEEFAAEFAALVERCIPDSAGTDGRNSHTSHDYRAIHFTGRQLIKYRNPFMSQFNEVRKAALQDLENPLAKQLLALDTTPISRDVRFFYPFEVQITDLESHQRNTQGEASHQEYKRSQVKSAMKRIFRPLIEFKNLNVS